MLALDSRVSAPDPSGFLPPAPAGTFLQEVLLPGLDLWIPPLVSAVPVAAVGIRGSLPLVTVGTLADCHLHKLLLA